MIKIQRGKKVQCLNCDHQFRSIKLTKNGVEPSDIKCGACHKRGVRPFQQPKGNEKIDEPDAYDMINAIMTDVANNENRINLMKDRQKEVVDIQRKILNIIREALSIIKRK